MVILLSFSLNKILFWGNSRTSHLSSEKNVVCSKFPHARYRSCHPPSEQCWSCETTTTSLSVPSRWTQWLELANQWTGQAVHPTLPRPAATPGSRHGTGWTGRVDRTWRWPKRTTIHVTLIRPGTQNHTIPTPSQHNHTSVLHQLESFCTWRMHQPRPTVKSADGIDWIKHCTVINAYGIKRQE